MRDIPKLSEQKELSDWVKKSFDGAVENLLKRGVADSLLVEAKPEWMLPFQILIGKMRDREQPGKFLWFICGDTPTDCIPGSSAATAREAARHFALKWQLDASRAGSLDEGLSVKAGSLYELVEEDSFWVQS